MARRSRANTDTYYPFTTCTVRSMMREHALGTLGFDMAIDWTMLSERVKNFGDLINLFEALDHPLPSAIASRVSEKSDRKRSGHSVEFGNSSVSDPPSDTTTGLRRIITFVERECGTGLSLGALRRIRGRVSETPTSTLPR